MKRLLLIGGLLLCVLVASAALFVLYHLPIDTRDPSPVQPIAFSHAQHAGEYEIACRYCHRGVDVSPVAAIPPVATCESCHIYIAADKPEIITLLDYAKRKEPIPWEAVYVLPDHVYFPHMMHLRAGIDCAHCHDEVAAMQRITRSVSLKMGWCLGCHREHRASIDCWTCHI